MSVTLREIHKRFGAVHANAGVSLSVESGELHGLLGENGAGKSTLMKILSGFISPDSGAIEVDGAAVPLGDPIASIDAGIGMLHQDPLVFLPFTVLENFIAAAGDVDRNEARRELERICAEFGFDLHPDRLARSLSVGERQQLEIARLLWLGAKVLILDEPTTGISAAQRESLFATLHRLADEGLSVIFVSHKLEEVEDLCSRVTVMTRGRVVGARDLPAPHSELIEMMFGREVTATPRPHSVLGSPALSASGAVPGERSLEPIDLTVAAGEVVGIAGVEGSGQRTALRMLAGLVPPVAGSVEIDGADLTGRPYRLFRNAGVAFLPAGRLEEGLVAGLTVAEHFALAGSPDESRVDWDHVNAEAVRLIDHFSIKARPDSPIESLSGGNQQRVLLAMLPDHIRVLLMEHPTRGLDIESAQWVWEQLLERRSMGTAIIFASADLDELRRYSDRIAVFYSGRMVGVLTKEEATVGRLGALMSGVSP